MSGTLATKQTLRKSGRLTFLARARNDHFSQPAKLLSSTHSPSRPPVSSSASNEAPSISSTYADEAVVTDAAGKNPGEDSTSELDSDPVQEERAVYLLRFVTSKESHSSNLGHNAGILVSLIGEDGKTIFWRIDPVGCPSGEDAEECLGSTIVADLEDRFQQGSVDVVKVTGANVGPVAALWIAPESGSWRLEEVTVTVFPIIPEDTGGSSAATSNGHMPAGKDDESETTSPSGDDLDNGSQVATPQGMSYLFRAESPVLLGDSEELPALEMKPLSATVVIQAEGGGEDELFPGAQGGGIEPALPSEMLRRREVGLLEYQALKKWLLGTTAWLVGAGTATAWALGGQNTALGFALGGTGALLYVLRLQNWVDRIMPPSNENDMAEETGNSGGDAGVELAQGARDTTEAVLGAAQVDSPPVQLVGLDGHPIPGSPSPAEDIGERTDSIQTLKNRGALQSLQGPAIRVAVTLLAVLAASSLADEARSGSGRISVPPVELLAGVLGFLTYKVAVLMAAFRPSILPVVDRD